MPLESSVLIEALGWTLLHSVWQGCVIVAAYAAASRLPQLRSPTRRLALGHLALLALACWPLLTLVAQLQLPTVGATPVDPAVAAPVALATSATALAGRIDISAGLPWLVGLWALGVMLLGLRAGLRWRVLQTLCRNARPVQPEWQAVLSLWQSRLGVGLRVRLLESAEVAVPIVVGVLRPVILLPLGMALRLTPAQLELIIAHELAHVRRWDAIANALQLLVETLLFHHPAVHWLSRRIREDRELCCDDLVAHHGGDPIQYARALLAAAEAQRAAQPSRLVLAATGGALLRRIERIVADPQRASTVALPVEWPRMLPMLVAGAVLLLALRFAGQEAKLLSALPLPALDTRIDWSTDWEPPRVADPSITRLRIALPVIQPQLGAVDTARREPEPEPMQATDLPLQFERLPLPAMDLAVTNAPELTPIERVLPEYPRLALLRGVEGNVELSYRVGADGRVFDLRLEAAEPAGVFDEAAKTALRRWRFPPQASSSAPRRQVFAFSLPDGRDHRGNCEAPTGTRICRPSPGAP